MYLLTKRVKRYIFLTFLLFTKNLLFSQNFVSEYYTTPFLLNPANTGKVLGDYRLGGVHRNENNISSQITRAYFFYDTKLLKSVLPKNDVFGIGCSGFSDKNLFYGLKNNNFLLSFSYSKGLSEEKLQQIGVGFQLGISNKRISQPNLIFPDQIIRWSQIGFNNITLTPGKVIIINYFDFNIGLNYQTEIGTKNILNVGAGVQHTNSPYKVFEGGEFTLLPEFFLQSGLQTKITDKNRLNTSINLNGILADKKISDYNIGCIYEMAVNTSKYKLYVGSFFRKTKINNSQVLAPLIGLGFNSLKLNLLYSVNISSNSIAPVNGLEIGIIFIKMRLPKK